MPARRTASETHGQALGPHRQDGVAVEPKRYQNLLTDDFAIIGAGGSFDDGRGDSMR